MYNHIIHPIAQKEFETSVERYSIRSEKAVRNFILEVGNTIETICSNPYQFRNEYKNFHELGLKKYPFSIIYVINDSLSLIVITSVFHHKRNPKKKIRK